MEATEKFLMILSEKTSVLTFPTSYYGNFSLLVSSLCTYMQTAAVWVGVITESAYILVYFVVFLQILLMHFFPRKFELLYYFLRMAFCFGSLLWLFALAFWFGFLIWLFDLAFWFGYLIWLSILAFWFCYWFDYLIFLHVFDLAIWFIPIYFSF